MGVAFPKKTWLLRNKTNNINLSIRYFVDLKYNERSKKNVIDIAKELWQTNQAFYNDRRGAAGPHPAAKTAAG